MLPKTQAEERRYIQNDTMAYPTDLSLLNEAREISEAIIDTLHPLSGMKNVFDLLPVCWMGKVRAIYVVS